MFSSGEYKVNNNKEKIKDILQSNGYIVTDCGNYIQFPALWRNGDDKTSVTCYTDTGKVIDWVTAEHFDVKELFARVLNLKSEVDINNAIEKNNISFNHVVQKIEQKKKFDKELLLHLAPDYSYPVSRGISEETCKLFRSGYVGNVKGKQKHRFMFPIFNSKDEIVGFTGRSLDNNDKIKWKHTGSKSDWVWPAYLNSKQIGTSKCCILVESPMCVLKLFDNNIKNVLCLFGTELHLGILNYLLRRNVDKIIISTNNELDSKNGGVGNEAAIKIKNKLSRYFDSKNVIIKLPPIKDFADCTNEQVINWREELKLSIGDKYLKYE